MVAVAILAGVLAGISNTGLLILINSALSRVGSPTSALIWSFAALCLAMLVCRGAASVLLILLARGAVFDLRMKLSRKILGAPLRHLEEVGAPRLLATLTDDVLSIANALVTLPVLCMHFAVVLTCLVYLAWLSWPVFFGVLGFMVFGVVSYQIPLTRAMRYINRCRQEWDKLFKHFGALTTGAKELKLHHARRESFLNEQLEPTAQAFRHYGNVGDIIFSIAASWGQLLVFALIGLLIFLVPTLINTNATTITGYSLVILYIMTPLEVILNTLPVLGRANVAMQQVESLGLSLEKNSSEALALTTPVREVGSYDSLVLSGVTHAYHGDRDNHFMLGPIDLEFSPGQLIFLVGGNGSGKTTLAKLITGLYVPESGEIRLNGKTVDDQNREQYRQLFSVVFSDFYLFESLLGLHTPKLDEQARNYLLQLHLDHKVEVENGVLSTTALSQGQRKRLALLTAYLEDRPFYVFDEWAADQDPVFKEIFYLQLLPELKAKGKTILVISHDDRYYHVADFVVKLDYGKITSLEDRNHPQLLTVNL
jgi:putative ATP-binding cassette transporter